MATRKKTRNIRKAQRRYRFDFQKIILGVIILTFLIVILALVLVMNLSPEKVTQANISDLARNYYEEFLYQNIENGDKEMIQKYEKYGFSNITLRQLVHLDQNEVHEKSESDISNLKKYCDENGTYVKFYPEAPYGKSDYRFEITYSCDF